MMDLDPAAGEIGQTELLLGREMMINDVSEFVNALTDPSGPRDPELDNESLDRLIAFGVFIQGAGKVALEYRAKLNEAKSEYFQDVTELLGSVSLTATSDEIVSSDENQSDIQLVEENITGEDEEAQNGMDDQTTIASDNDVETSTKDVDTDETVEEAEVATDVSDPSPENGLKLNTEATFILSVIKTVDPDQLLERSIFDSAGFKEIKDRKNGAHDMAFSNGMKQLMKEGLVEKVSRGKYRYIGPRSDSDFLAQ